LTDLHPKSSSEGVKNLHT